ncbi:MAG: two-component system response regulator, partial [Myxococcaceae bacterium]|nr:two-component system response regulator [Myxococcaceae bacterium]
MASKATVVPKTVLVVEDDPPLRKLVAGYLKLLNFAVIEAADGKKAMTALGEQPYDLICLDLMLPESSGYDVLEFIRKEGLARVPVLMMSARSLPEDRAQAEELGATLYLIKPFTRSDFTKAVKAV